MNACTENFQGRWLLLILNVYLIVGYRLAMFFIIPLLNQREYKDLQ